MPITPKRSRNSHRARTASRSQSSTPVFRNSIYLNNPPTIPFIRLLPTGVCRTTLPHVQATLRQGRYIHVTCKPNGLPVAATSGAQDAGSSERRVAQQGNPYLPKRTGCHIRQPAPSETCYQPGLYVFHKSQPTWRFRCGMATQTRLPYRI